MSSTKPYILGINGSPHKDGLVTEIIQGVLDGAKSAGAEVKLVHLYDLSIIHEPGYYSEDPEKEVPANMSGVMKDFIDHLIRRVILNGPKKTLLILVKEWRHLSNYLRKIILSGTKMLTNNLALRYIERVTYVSGLG